MERHGAVAQETAFGELLHKLYGYVWSVLQVSSGTIFNEIKMFLLLFNSSSGMGLWYPEILNRLGSTMVEDSVTVCEVIDASIDQSSMNVTSIVSKKLDYTVITYYFNCFCRA